MTADTMPTFNAEWHRMGDGTRVPVGRGCWVWCRDYNRPCVATWNGQDWLDQQDRVRRTIYWAFIPSPNAPRDLDR